MRSLILRLNYWWSCLSKPLKGNSRQSLGRLFPLRKKFTFTTARPAREPTAIRRPNINTPPPHAKNAPKRAFLRVVEVVGVVPLAGTPRSDVINVVLCQQATYIRAYVRQSILLPQNGSHPQLRPQRPLSTNKKYPTRGYFCLWWSGFNVS